MSVDLTIAWAIILSIAVGMYVVLDGFDLGVGILFPFYDHGEERDQAINAIAPVWDGNETWLVMGGGGLFAAFPLAYAILLPATYPLVIAMLLGLVFRGVAFEFRWRDPRHMRWWDIGFTTGSIVAAMAQGMILGALVQGIKVGGRAYAGGWLDWLTPYSLLTGFGVVAGYALLGATFLALKVEGRAEEHSFRLARIAGWAVLLLMIAVSLYTPFLTGQYRARWFSTPAIFYAAPVPLITGLLFLGLGRSLGKKARAQPFLFALGIFLMGGIGLAFSMWPFIIPGAVTIWQAAAPARSQAFMLVGTLIILPIILGYTAWSYWVFRGKVGTEGYH